MGKERSPTFRNFVLSNWIRKYVIKKVVVNGLRIKINIKNIQKSRHFEFHIFNIYISTHLIVFYLYCPV